MSRLSEHLKRLEAESIEIPDEEGLAEREARLDATRAALEAAQEEIAALQHALPEAQAALRSAIDLERQAQRRLTELRARRDALVQLQHKVQSQGALGDWLKRHGYAELEPLWQTIRVAPGWEMAVEAALRERLAAFGLLQILQELARARPGNGAEVLCQLGLGHANAVVPNRQRAGRCVRDDADLQDLSVVQQSWLFQCCETSLVERVGGVRNQLAQEDLLVAVQGVDHQIEDLADLGLK